MTLSNTDPTLYALFCLRRHGLPVHSGTLGRLTERSASQTALDLLKLEGLGLVDANSARLTMLGLARGAELARAASEGSRRVEARVANAPAAIGRIKPPVAARRGRDSAAVPPRDEEEELVPPALSA